MVIVMHNTILSAFSMTKSFDIQTPLRRRKCVSYAPKLIASFWTAIPCAKYKSDSQSKGTLRRAPDETKARCPKYSALHRVPVHMQFFARFTICIIQRMYKYTTTYTINALAGEHKSKHVHKSLLHSENMQKSSTQTQHELSVCVYGLCVEHRFLCWKRTWAALIIKWAFTQFLPIRALNTCCMRYLCYYCQFYSFVCPFI